MGFSSSGTQAWLLRHMWNLPRSGIELRYPGLADAFFFCLFVCFLVDAFWATGPPVKSIFQEFYSFELIFVKDVGLCLDSVLSLFFLRVDFQLFQQRLLTRLLFPLDCLCSSVKGQLTLCVCCFLFFLKSLYFSLDSFYYPI